MSRMRIVPLPVVTVGESSQTPYLVIFDRLDDGFTEVLAAERADLRENTGAVGVLAFRDEIDL